MVILKHLLLSFLFVLFLGQITYSAPLTNSLVMMVCFADYYQQPATTLCASTAFGT